MRLTTLEQEILRSEILRTTVFLVIFSIVVLYLVIWQVFFPDVFGSVYVYARQFGPWIPAIFSFFIALYYAALRFLLKAALDRSLSIPKIIQYVTLFIETSLPTMFLYYAAINHPIMFLLVSPRMPLYFLFIILSALTLNVRLCIFTGIVAALEYVGLCVYFSMQSHSFSEPNTYIASLMDHFSIIPLVLGHMIIFVIAGFVVAFVTQQIKNSLFAVFEATKEREHVANVFGRHVSPEVVSMLLNQGKKLTSEAKEVCVLFLDIRGFTTFSENRKPEDVVSYLNYLFGFMVEIINAHHGIINKFLGDGFMAVFGAPMSGDHDPDNAVSAAEEILRRIKKEVAQGAIPDTRVGIGIHYGTVVTGTVGAFQRQEYTIIGDVVNLASRIEKLNKTYQSQLLISEDVHQVLQEKRGTLLGEVAVTGRKKPIKVYQLM